MSPARFRCRCESLRASYDPGAVFCLGFFTGPSIERFDHAVIGAYFWPVETLSAEVQNAGFDIVETHTRTGQGYRPHGAILARRRTDA